MGRRPSRVAIALVSAVPIALAIWQREQAFWILPFFFLVPAAGFAWLWLHRDRTQVELGAIEFFDELRVEVRNIDPPPLFGLLGTISGRVRLLVGPDTIALRGITSGGIRVSGFGSSFGTFELLDYTFRPEDCEVERPRMGVSSFFVSLGKPAIVLRCADGRRTVELVLSRPAITALEDVQRELIWAGARALDGQPVGEPARLHRPPPAPGQQPPYWPPPPGWHPDGPSEA
jgi:hypothetical protein